jgi:predicted exporter
MIPRGASIANDQGAAGEIYTLGEHLQKSIPGLKLYYSGVPFHSYESAENAKQEISPISAVTLIIVTVLFFYIFRSVLPVLIFVLAIAASILLALVVSLLFFREIHILSFVFGTTLIGICVDYSIHFFVHWKGDATLKNSTAAGRRILSSVTMSFISSELCFAALFLAPFPILKQFAVFSAAGLLSSYLTVTCLYPLLRLPAPEKRRILPLPFLPDRKKPPRIFKRVEFLRRGLLPAMILLSLSCVFFHRDRIRIANDITGLYTMSATLRESEILSAVVMNRGTTPWYFIVAGDSPEELLEHEETLARRLDTEKAQGKLGSYLAASLFVPSLKTQNRNYNASRSLFPLVEAQFDALGFPSELVKEFRREFESLAGHYSSIEDLPSYLRNMISNLWIGEVEGRYYSCVLPVNAADAGRFRVLAEDLDNVFFMNKAADIGQELDRLTRTMLILLLTAYVCIVLIAAFRYRPIDTLRIGAVPLIMTLAVLAVLAATDTALGFFPVVGLLLVFGLGLDYMFYRIDGGAAGKSLTCFAIVLSYITTALSFGALVLSTFVPIHVFGLTVFAGLSSAFISAMLLSGRVSSENQRNAG